MSASIHIGDDEQARHALLGSSAPYRDASYMHSLVERLASVATRPWRIMEVCGGQTFTLSRYRLEELLPAGITMLHGPGCPVCVTPASTIDLSVALARRSDITLCSFGDMIRVPGSGDSLLRARADGADVRILYTPLDALQIAADNPERQVVFLAIGFETTTPAYAFMVKRARDMGLTNFSLLTSLFTVPAAVHAVVNDPDSRVDALLAAGHVCAVTGTAPYKKLASELGMPVVITGFEPVDMLMGILRAVEMLEQGEAQLANAYERVVRDEGATPSIAAVNEVFMPYDAEWRGLGHIPQSGMKLRPEFEQFDARSRFYNVKPHSSLTSSIGEECIAHLIMKGVKNPSDCKHFRCRCTPTTPVGAPMVSAEGVCAAHYRYFSPKK